MMPKFLPICVLLTTASCLVSACSSTPIKNEQAMGGGGGAGPAPGGSSAKGGAALGGNSMGTGGGMAMDGGGAPGSGAAGKGGAGKGGAGKGGSGPAGGAAATIPGCDGACEGYLGAQCTGVTVTQEECAADCSIVNPACKAELSTYMTCVAEQATFTCGESGPVFSGCEAESVPFGVCTACDADDRDSACYGCAKTNCCAGLKSYSGASDVAEFDACAFACGPEAEYAACIDTCVTRFPNAGKAYDSVISCEDASCAEPCICGATADDEPCETCLKTSCCAGMVAYSQAPDIDTFVSCASGCSDQPCFDACVAASPEAAAGYEQLYTCLDASCADACAGP